MAQEPIYRPRVAPAGSAGLPGAGADAFGGDIGRGLAQLGGMLHETDLRAYQIERRQVADAEASDFAGRFAEAREAADAASREARANAPAGAPGHEKAMAAWWEERSAGLLDGILDDHVRRQASEQVREFGGRLRGAEAEYEAGSRVGKMTRDQQRASEIGANRARLAHDPKSYAEELSLGRQAIDTLQGVPAEVKDKLHRYHDETVTVGYLNGLNDTNPRAAMALLDGGAFNDILTPDEIDRARSGAEVEVRRSEAAAQAQASLAKAQARETLATLSARIEAGEEVPAAELAQGSRLAASLGDESGAYKLGVAQLKAGINRETQPWAPAQFETAINQLRGLGSKRTGAQDVRLRQLEAIAPGRVAEFNRNPGAWAASNGNPPPALDLGQAGSVQARLGWARGVSAATGRPVPVLTPAEAADLAAGLATPAGRLDVANRLAAFGGASAVGAARQVAPGDAMLARLVTLGPQQRAAVIDGQATRKAYPRLVDGQNGQAAREAFNARFGAAGALLAGEDVAATFEVARNLYADWAGKHGVQAYEDFNEGVWDQILHRSLGGTRDAATGRWRGGLGQWNGARVLLPGALSQEGFDGAMARLAWDAKNPRAPVFRNGTTMTPAQVRDYTPVRRPDGRYEFHGADGAVLATRGGDVWTLDIAAIGTKLGTER